MKEVNNKSKKKFPVKLASGIGGVLIIILIILIFNKGKIIDKFDQNEITTNPFTKENFNYLDNQIINKEQVKKECVYIRVGRCNAIGGEFGAGCWMRDVNIRFSGDSIDADNIQCVTSTNLKSEPQTSNLEIGEENIYNLKIKADMRQNNKLKICCTDSQTQEELCFEDLDVVGIC